MDEAGASQHRRPGLGSRPPPEERAAGAGSPRPHAQRWCAPRRVSVTAKLLASAGAAVVVVGRVPGCTSSGHPQAAPSPSKSPAAKITSITATPFNAQEIDLEWVTSGGAHWYVVTRDGTWVATVTDGTSYNDTGLKPKKTYTYEVDFTSSSGNDTPGASVTATTPKLPPLSKARLSGPYVVRFIFTAENYTNRSVGDKYGERWKLKPKCPDGACSTLLLTNLTGSKSGVLTLHGGAYHGSVSDTLFICQGTHERETVTVTLHVTRGEFLHGQWTATTFAGMISDYAPAGGGCVSGSSKSSMTARRL
jgi:hypothetical protein